MRRLLLSAACLAVFSGAPALAATCTLIVDAQTGTVLVRDGICDRRVAPMSSFKLPLALMGYDSGILVDEHAPRWDYRKELNALRAEDKAAHDPTSWEKISVLWFSQELTRKLGAKRFGDYVTAFGYGNRDVSGNPGKNDGLTHAWLMSSLMVSADEQVAFLRKVTTRALPLSAHAYDMTARIIPEFAAGDWQVQGKTGSGWQRDARGRIDRSRPVGWFVGWARKESRTLVFARLFLGDAPSKTYGGFTARDGLLADLPALADQKGSRP